MDKWFETMCFQTHGLKPFIHQSCFLYKMLMLNVDACKTIDQVSFGNKLTDMYLPWTADLICMRILSDLIQWKMSILKVFHKICFIRSTKLDSLW